MLLYAGSPLRPSVINEVQNNPHLRGVCEFFEWSELETSMGVYDFTRIQQDLDAMAAAGAHLVIMIRDKRFGTGAAVPAYMQAPGPPYEAR